MGTCQLFKPVKLFSGIIYKDTEICERVIHRLSDSFSEIDLQSERIPFDSTCYYHREMGAPLFRKFVSFSRLISPQRLAEIKVLTNRLENEFSLDNQRSVNIDPGYLSEANVIIATTKNYYHRVPLSDGIYAHLEYVIKKKKIVPLEWTYPDFRKDAYIQFFEHLRILYRKRK